MQLNLQGGGKMRKYVKYEIELVTKAPFRIGGVKPVPGTTDVDSPIVKLGNRVVVQGTSLKGALRAELERYMIDQFFDKANNQWKDEWMKPCIPADIRTISPDEKKLIERGLYKYSCHYPNKLLFELRQNIESILRSRNLSQLQREFKEPLSNNAKISQVSDTEWEIVDSPNRYKITKQNDKLLVFEDDYICPICYLLGARGLVGFVEVPFLNIEKGSAETLQFIREDRVVGTSAKGERGALGKYEAVPQGSVFKGVMTILEEDDIIEWKLGEPRDLAESKGDKWLESGNWTRDKILKELIEDRLKAITKLGGYKSKGFGDVQINVRKL